MLLFRQKVGICHGDHCSLYLLSGIRLSLRNLAVSGIQSRQRDGSLLGVLVGKIKTRAELTLLQNANEDGEAKFGKRTGERIFEEIMQ